MKIKRIKNDLYIKLKIFKSYFDLPVIRSLTVALLFSFVILYISISNNDYYNDNFWEGVRIEAHGMLFDLWIIGVFIFFLNEIVRKRSENQKYKDEIDDFRDWKSEEAKYRIVGNIKRLNRNNVANIDLHGCYLKKADLFEANLARACLFGANLEGANLTDVNLEGADFAVANFARACLYNINFRRASLFGANLEGTNFHVVDLFEANLTKANFKEADLSGTNFEGANFTKANLERANLEGANLTKANFKEADLFGVNLFGANLKGADFFGTNLARADLRGAENLTIDQLSDVKTLYLTKLDSKLVEQVRKKYLIF